MSKRGFTLMELLVYIAIMGIVVLVAGQAFSDSSRMRVRTESMLKASQIAGNVGQLLKDDAAQMGAKSALDPTNSTNTSDAFIFNDNVYMNASNSSATLDSSSYSITQENGFDDITLRRINYSDAGAFVRVEEIVWFVRNGSLYRSCQTLNGTENTETCPAAEPIAVLIADGVTKFAATPAKPGLIGSTNLLFPYYPADLSKKTFRLVSYYGADNYQRVITTPVSGGERISLSGLVSNYSEDGTVPTEPIKHQIFIAESGSTLDGISQCKKILLKPDSSYEISFNMFNGEDEARMFQPGIDHFSVGVRQIVDSRPVVVPEIPDFFFYPPQADDGNGTRYMRFRGHFENELEACVAFTLVLSSPTVALGKFSISDFRMRRIGDTDYIFENGFVPNIEDKKNVRAMRVEIEIKKKGEAGKSNIVIQIPSNGVRG